MSLFSWIKRSNDPTVQPQDEMTSRKTSGVIVSRILIRELLRHMEEQKRLANNLEGEHGSDHSAPGHHWLQGYPNLHTLITTSELRQLEYLCARVPPIHAANVLSRYLVAAIPCSRLTLGCCQQWLDSTASIPFLTAGKTEKTQRGWGARRAAKKASLCYCHRDRRCRPGTCEVDGCHVRLNESLCQL